jgi:hypothetical protein
LDKLPGCAHEGADIIHLVSLNPPRFFIEQLFHPAFRHVERSCRSRQSGLAAITRKKLNNTADVPFYFGANSFSGYGHSTSRESLA